MGARSPHLSLPLPPPPQARPVALRRPGDTPLSLSPEKRVCTSPLGPVEGSLVGPDSGQVSPRGGREARGGRRAGAAVTALCPHPCPAAGAPALPAMPQQEQQPQRPENPALGLRLRAGLGRGYTLGGQASRGPRGRGPGNATCRGCLGGWGAGRDRVLKVSLRSGGATAVDN